MGGEDRIGGFGIIDCLFALGEQFGDVDRFQFRGGCRNDLGGVIEGDPGTADRLDFGGKQVVEEVNADHDGNLRVLQADRGDGDDREVFIKDRDTLLDLAAQAAGQQGVVGTGTLLDIHAFGEVADHDAAVLVEDLDHVELEDRLGRFDNVGQLGVIIGQRGIINSIHQIDIRGQELDIIGNFRFLEGDGLVYEVGNLVDPLGHAFVQLIFTQV